MLMQEKPNEPPSIIDSVFPQLYATLEILLMMLEMIHTFNLNQKCRETLLAV